MLYVLTHEGMQRLHNSDGGSVIISGAMSRMSSSG